jgi:hypothetical protein
MKSPNEQLLEFLDDDDKAEILLGDLKPHLNESKSLSDEEIIDNMSEAVGMCKIEAFKKDIFKAISVLFKDKTVKAETK